LPALAVKVLVPSERVAPTGIEATLTARVSEPSASTREDEIESGIAVSSLPAAAATTRVGVSATALTVTARLALVVATDALAVSVAVALTARVKSVSLLGGGVMLRVGKFQPVTATL